MNLAGQNLSFPFRADSSGGLVSTSDRSQVIAEAIIDVLETRQGERVMIPDYGIPDFVFAVMDAGFLQRLAYYLELQITSYVPLVSGVTLSSSLDDEGRAVIDLQYTEVGAINAPRNLVFPVWRLLPDV
jgi:phage baseplate assembly protein W